VTTTKPRPSCAVVAGGTRFRGGGAEGIRTPDLLRWTGRPNASSNLDPSLPNPPDLGLLPRIGPLPASTLPDSLGATRRTSDVTSADLA